MAGARLGKGCRAANRLFFESDHSPPQEDYLRYAAAREKLKHPIIPEKFAFLRIRSLPVNNSGLFCKERSVEEKREISRLRSGEARIKSREKPS